MNTTNVAVLALLTCLVAACGDDPTEPEDSTDPRDEIPAEVTHPEGELVDSIALLHRPYGVVVLSDGRALITREDAAYVSIVDVYDVTVRGGLAVGDTPGDIILSPDEEYAYVVNHYGSTIGRIDIETLTHETLVPIGNDPVAIAVSADGATLYFTDNRGLLHIADATTGALRTSLSFDNIGTTLSGPVLHPTEPRLFFTSPFTGEVCTVDTDSEEILECRDVGGKPQRQAVDPDGTRLFTASEVREVLDVWSLDEDRLLQSLAIGPCNMIVFTPDGEQIYVSQSLVGRLTVLDAEDLTVVWSMETTTRPRWIGFTEKGDRAVVAAEGGQVYIIR